MQSVNGSDTSRKRILIAGSVLAALFGTARSGRGDAVTISDPVVFASPVTLSSGTSDWVYYGVPNDPTSNGNSNIGYEHAAATNFSNVSAIQANLNGFDNTASGYPLFNWSGGSPDSTGSSHSWAYDEFSSGNGLTFSLLVAPGSETVSVYANNFAPLSYELEASLSSGASAPPDTASLPGNADLDHHYGVYTIGVANTSAVTETLTVAFIQTNSNGNANIGLYGASVAAVPEPASTGIAVIGCMGILARRWRNSESCEKP